jgi:hypothetical protein
LRLSKTVACASASTPFERTLPLFSNHPAALQIATLLCVRSYSAEVLTRLGQAGISDHLYLFARWIEWSDARRAVGLQVRFEEVL